MQFLRRRKRRKAEELIRAVPKGRSSMDKRKSNLTKTSAVKVKLSQFVGHFLLIPTEGRTSKSYPAAERRTDGWWQGRKIIYTKKKFLLKIASRWEVCWSRLRRWWRARTWWRRSSTRWCLGFSGIWERDNGHGNGDDDDGDDHCNGDDDDAAHVNGDGWFGLSTSRPSSPSWRSLPARSLCTRRPTLPTRRRTNRTTEIPILVSLRPGNYLIQIQFIPPFFLSNSGLYNGLTLKEAVWRNLKKKLVDACRLPLPLYPNHIPSSVRRQLPPPLSLDISTKKEQWKQYRGKDHSADQLLQCQQGQTTWTEFLEDQHQGLNFSPNLNAELQWVQSFRFKLPNFQFLNNKELSIA